jgi:hypothetical protein
MAIFVVGISLGILAAGLTLSFAALDERWPVLYELRFAPAIFIGELGHLPLSLVSLGMSLAYIGGLLLGALSVGLFLVIWAVCSTYWLPLE